MNKFYLKFLKEPLVHFLFAAFTLFAIYDAMTRDTERKSPNEILVTRNDLLVYMQYRAKAFDAARSEHSFDNLSDDERRKLIADYVREEAMYREAKALGLDRNDYVAKRRLMQQLEFITQGFAETAVELSEAGLETYYQDHRSQYAIPPKITFTHVFFSHERHGLSKATELAKKELAHLNHHGTPFHKAMAHGDRAIFHVNYVRREKDLVASHFGAEMADALFRLTPDDTTWRGPFRSPYGMHLVMATEISAAYEPRLAEIRDRVAADARAALLEDHKQRAINEIVATYRVRISDDLTGEP